MLRLQLFSSFIFGLIYNACRILVLILGLIGAVDDLPGDENEVRLSGILEQQSWDPQKGGIYQDDTFSTRFDVHIRGDNYKIIVHKPEMWGHHTEIFYDGKDMYVLQRLNNTGEPDRAYISRGPYFNPDFDPPCGMEVLWMAFGLNAENYAERSIEIPHPWTNARIRGGAARGHEWIIEPAERNRRFAGKVDIIRDTSKDFCTVEEELLRHDSIYPGTEEFHIEILQRIKARNEEPDGYVKGGYQCEKWIADKNGVSYPAVGKFWLTWWPWTKPAKINTFRVMSFRVSDPGVSTIGKPVFRRQTVVRDYRLKGRQGDVIFEYAEYTAQESDSWREEADSELNHQKDIFLKNGPVYNAGLPELFKKK